MASVVGSPIGLLLVLTYQTALDISYTEILRIDLTLNKTVAVNVELNKIVTMDDYDEMESTA